MNDQPAGDVAAPFWCHRASHGESRCTQECVACRAESADAPSFDDWIEGQMGCGLSRLEVDQMREAWNAARAAPLVSEPAVQVDAPLPPTDDEIQRLNEASRAFFKALADLASLGSREFKADAMRREWIDREQAMRLVPALRDRFANVAQLARRLLADRRQRAAEQPDAQAEFECNNCEWSGPLSETCMLGDVGPLCPQCRETTGPKEAP